MEHSDFPPPPLRSLALRSAVPHRCEGDGISQVPGKPLRTCPGLRPRWVVASGLREGATRARSWRDDVAFRILNGVGSHSVQPFRGSFPRPARSLSTLRRAGCPDATQDSLPAGGQPCRSGLSPADFHVRFQFLQVSTWHPPHPGFAWRTQNGLPKGTDWKRMIHRASPRSCELSHRIRGLQVTWLLCRWGPAVPAPTALRRS
jgi:hypothetical protein